MKIGAVIVAAGRGERMGKGRDKLFYRINGVPLLALCLMNFQDAPEVEGIVVVMSPAARKRYRDEISGSYELPKVIRLAAGGRRRQDSVFKGLLAFPEPPETVLIHDGDRPFAGPELIRAVTQGCAESGAIPAVRVRDTVKWVEKGGVIKTLERDRIWLAQTPQAFPYPLILAAHRKARKEGRVVTDDASLIEAGGGRVKIVEGSYDNIKITTPEDLRAAEMLRAGRAVIGDQ